MASSLPTAMGTPTKSLLETIAQILGVDFTLLDNQFKLTIQGVPDGGVYASLQPANGQTQVDKFLSTGSFAVPANEGTLDADIVSGTSALVASTVDITIAGGVPVGSAVYATVQSAAGTAKLLSAVRLSATQIRVSSPGSGFGALLSSAAVSAVLAAGVNATVALANVAGDVLAVQETATGGTAADHFSIVRVSDSLVKVQAHNSAGALVGTNTSTVSAYNFGQAAHETSTIRYVVVRP